MMLTVKQLAKKLNLSQNTIYRMVRQRNIPFYRVGSGRGSIRFDENQIDKWLKKKIEI